VAFRGVLGKMTTSRFFQTCYNMVVGARQESELCRGHFPVSGRRREIKLKKQLHTGHFKPAAVVAGFARIRPPW
jgi:hypothetical protein